MYPQHIISIRVNYENTPLDLFHFTMCSLNIVLYLNFNFKVRVYKLMFKVASCFQQTFLHEQLAKTKRQICPYTQPSECGCPCKLQQELSVHLQCEVEYSRKCLYIQCEVECLADRSVVQ